MVKKWTDEEVDFLKENYGIISLEEISSRLNRTIESIKHKAIRDNIPSARKWTDEEIQYLKDHYKDKTYKELAKDLGKTKTAVDLKCQRLGLVKSPYTYNHQFFKEITTEEQAYWCGFIMADGNVWKFDETNSCELCIKLQAGDGNHLKKFNKALNGNIPVTYFTKVRTFPGADHENHSRQAQIRIYSEEMFHDIAKYGVIPAKSLIKEFPINIPSNLINHYIRGYYDGNGTISLSGYKKNPPIKKYIACGFATGSKKFAEGLANELHKNNIATGKIYKTKNGECYRLNINGMQNVDNFLNFLYKDSTVYLDRKFNKKVHLYEITDMEQRLLRQAEMPVHSRNESSEEEIGKAEMLIRVEGRGQNHGHTQSVQGEPSV